MKLRCTFHVDDDGTTELRWKNNDIITGPGAAATADQIRAYVSAAMMFASEMGGMEQAYNIMQANVRQMRATVKKTMHQFASATAEASSQSPADPETSSSEEPPHSGDQPVVDGTDRGPESSSLA